MSLALKHKRRVLDHGSAAVGTPYTPATALAGPANAQKHLALMTSALAVDCARLSDLNAMEARQRLKREELLPKYLEYVERYHESGLNHPNPVLVQVLVWLFDTEQFEQGLELADFAMAQNQAMPERFKRDIPTFIGDAVADWADAEYKAGRSPEPYLSQLLPRVDGEWQLFEKIPARYHKLLGLIAFDQERWSEAIAHFERATHLYPGIGVKTKQDDAHKALKKQQAD
ncbi:phage terminase small subunit [Pseudomonas sp. CCI4.2]|uniref:phage terminase small subunit n=1 Tax=Pseudomonas sp. CCI4.2 TaxID=3048620 RepID=UPI002AC8C56C|nr:phage terminase small subunit [Pseudomonas sp. CCI4.2]MEB0090061.1 phage terminase small subunit [Pseudomonas sp. CCI4.2]WPX53475.1 phage terminase small subunit [Pseudomonas sp. CCI4.2]